MSYKYNKESGLFLPNQPDEKIPLDLSESEPIEISQDQKLTQDNIESYIEVPLIEAMRTLRLKNIPTKTSSANHKVNEAKIVLDFDGLCSNNKIFANKLVKQGLAIFDESSRGENERTVDIILQPEKPDISLPGNRIRTHFSKIADSFEPQDKVVKEIKFSDLKPLIAKQLGFRNFEHMQETRSHSQIKEYVTYRNFWEDKNSYKSFTSLTN